MRRRLLIHAGPLIAMSLLTPVRADATLAAPHELRVVMTHSSSARSGDSDRKDRTPDHFSSDAQDGDIAIKGYRSPSPPPPVPDAPETPPEPPTPDELLVEIIPMDYSDCFDLVYDGDALSQWCSPEFVMGDVELTCPQGSRATPPSKIHSRPTANEPWGPWRLHTPPCVPRTPTPDTIADVLEHEIKTLKIPPRKARVAPVTTWFVVQLPMTFYTDAGTETLTTTILGTQVEIELTPTSFSFDPGDGCPPEISTRPGARYPDQTITHTYTRKGDYQVTLTTTWSARFRIAGAQTWHTVTGTGTTTSSTERFETREVRSVLS